MGGMPAAGLNQGRIKRIQLCSNDGAILCFSRIVLAVVLVLVIGLFALVFDYDNDDEDDDDSRTTPSTRPGTLAALAKSSLMQPWVQTLRYDRYAVFRRLSAATMAHSTPKPSTSQETAGGPAWNFGVLRQQADGHRLVQLGLQDLGEAVADAAGRQVHVQRRDLGHRHLLGLLQLVPLQAGDVLVVVQIQVPGLDGLRRRGLLLGGCVDDGLPSLELERLLVAELSRRSGRT